jgi:hypothetical protein
VHQDLHDSSLEFRRDVDLRALDPAVGGDETVRERSGLGGLPLEVGEGATSDDGRAQE